jgi:hypothetical protein
MRLPRFDYKARNDITYCYSQVYHRAGGDLIHNESNYSGIYSLSVIPDAGAIAQALIGNPAIY